MKIDIRVRNASLDDSMRDHIDKRFARIARQVSHLARLHIDLTRERNPANPEPNVAEATLHLKGTVLKARESSGDMTFSVDTVAEKLARQVRKYLDKRHGQRH